jgi:hypothetical protein
MVPDSSTIGVPHSGNAHFFPDAANNLLIDTKEGSIIDHCVKIY